MVTDVSAISDKADKITLDWIRVNVQDALDHRNRYLSVRTTTVGTARIITNESNVPGSGMGCMCTEVLRWR